MTSESQFDVGAGREKTNYCSKSKRWQHAEHSARHTRKTICLPLRGPSIEGACCRWLRRAGRRQDCTECTVKVGVVVRQRCVKIDLQLVVSQGNARMYANVLVLTRYETGCLTHKQRASIDDLHKVGGHPAHANMHAHPTC